MIRKAKLTFLLALTFATSQIAFTQNKSIEKLRFNAGGKNSPGYNLPVKLPTLYYEPKNKNVRLTILLKNATLVKIFEEFRKQTTLSVLATIDVWGLKKVIDVNLVNVTVKEFLDYVCDQYSIDYEFRTETFFSLSLRPVIIKKLYGTVTDSLYNPLPGASITIKGTNISTTADENGIFEIAHTGDLAELTISHVGMLTTEIKADTENPVRAIMQVAPAVLAKVTYTFKDGYQDISQNDATGSYYQPDIGRYRKNPATNFIERLHGVSIQSSKNEGMVRGMLATPFRGSNTLNGNQFPSIVVDNFQFLENTYFINPNDIDTITNIRDAVSGSLWGTMAAHGVSVATTRTKGEGRGLEITIRNNFGLVVKPNLYYQPGIGTNAYIDLEKSLYRSGAIDNAGTYEKPVRDILEMERAGLIGPSKADSLIATFYRNDIRRDLLQHLHRTGINQQHHISVGYSNSKLNFYGSMGTDENKSPQKGNDFSRTTLFLNTSYKLKNFEFFLNNAISSISDKMNFVSVPLSVPFYSLKDAAGNPVAIPYRFSPAYIASMSSGGFLPWHYSPLEEAVLSDNRIDRELKSTMIRISYRFLKNFLVSTNYQHSNMLYYHRNIHHLASYFARNLANTYRQYDGSNISWPVPIGAIKDENHVSSSIRNLRSQLYYNLENENFHFNIMTGVEMLRQDLKITTGRVYGYDLGISQGSINFTDPFPVSTSPGTTSTIPYIDGDTDSTNRFLNYFLSSHFTYKGKYTISISGRKDESNRFTFPAIRRGFPLWSVGFAWQIDKDLKLRTSYGTSGNVNYLLPPFRTVRFNNQTGPDQVPGPVYDIANASSNGLTWEKLSIINAGIDFKLFKKTIWGAFDIYAKKANDLVQPTLANPTSGTTLNYDNSGKIKGYGWDLWLQTADIPLFNNISFSSGVFCTYTRNNVASKNAILYPAGSFTDPEANLSRYGDPVNAIYGYRFAGLNPTTGWPIGTIHGDKTEDYSAIYDDTSLTSIVCIGSKTPVFFGSVALSLNYNHLFLTIIANTRLGYYVWKRALNYDALLGQQDDGTRQFFDRWQKPGDEKHTAVPSLAIGEPMRDLFFARSTENVVSGDHIRLHSVQFGYNFNKFSSRKLPFKNLETWFTISNLGIIWRSNRHGIDPDVEIGSYPVPTGFNFTVATTF